MLETAQPSITELVPHRPNMLLVDELISAQGMSGKVLARVRDDLPYWQDGRFQDHWYIEIMAQSVAAIYGNASRKPGKKPNIGFLVAIDDFMIHPQPGWQLEPGMELVSDIVQTHDIFPLGLYNIRLESKEHHNSQRTRLIATARIKCGVAPDNFLEDGLLNAY